MFEKNRILTFFVVSIMGLSTCIVADNAKKCISDSYSSNSSSFLAPKAGSLDQDFEFDPVDLYAIDTWANENDIQDTDKKYFFEAVFSFKKLIPGDLEVSEILGYLEMTNLNLDQSKSGEKVRNLRRENETKRQLPVILVFKGELLKGTYEYELPTRLYFATRGNFNNSALSRGVAFEGVDLARAMSEKNPLWTYLKGKKTIGMIDGDSFAFLATSYGDPQKTISKGGQRLTALSKETTPEQAMQAQEDYVRAAVHAGFLGGEYLEGPDMIDAKRFSDGVNELMANTIDWANKAANEMDMTIIRPTTSSPDGFPHTVWRVTSLGAIATLMPFIENEELVELLGLSNKRKVKMIVQGMGDVGTGILKEAKDDPDFSINGKPIEANGVSDISGAVYVDDDVLSYEQVATHRNAFMESEKNLSVIDKFTTFSKRWLNPSFLLSKIPKDDEYSDLRLQLSLSAEMYQARQKGIVSPDLYRLVFDLEGSEDSQVDKHVKELNEKIQAIDADDTEGLIGEIDSLISSYRLKQDSFNEFIRLHIALNLKSDARIKSKNKDNWDNFVHDLQFEVKRKIDLLMGVDGSKTGPKDSVLRQVNELVANRVIDIPDGIVSGFDINDILFQETDILVPASIPNGVTSENAVKRLQAIIVLEAANNFVSPRASEFFLSNSKLLLYGPFVNGGGIKTSGDEVVFFTMEPNEEERKRNAEYSRLINRGEIKVNALINGIDVMRAYLGKVNREEDANINDVIQETSRQIDTKADEISEFESELPYLASQLRIHGFGKDINDPGRKKLLSAIFARDLAVKEVIHKRNVVRHAFDQWAYYFGNVLSKSRKNESISQYQRRALEDFVNLLNRSEWENILGEKFDKDDDPKIVDIKSEDAQALGYQIGGLSLRYQGWGDKNGFKSLTSEDKLLLFYQAFKPAIQKDKEDDFWHLIKTSLFERLLKSENTKNKNYSRRISLNGIERVVNSSESTGREHLFAIETLGYGEYEVLPTMKLIKKVIEDKDGKYSDFVRARAMVAFWNMQAIRITGVMEMAVADQNFRELYQSVIYEIKNIYEKHNSIGEEGELIIDELGAWAHWTLYRADPNYIKDSLPHEHLTKKGTAHGSMLSLLVDRAGSAA